MRIVTPEERRRARILRRCAQAATIGAATAISAAIFTAPTWVATPPPEPTTAAPAFVGPLELVDGHLVPVLEHIGAKP